MTLVIGIDGGGTSCRAALATADGRIIGRGKSGAANIRTDLTGARASIVEAARLAFLDAGRDPGLMAADAGPARPCRQQCRHLPAAARGHPAVPAQCREKRCADRARRRASAIGDGAIAVLGTGSAYMARTDGELRSIGGWGFMVGDQGSGARIGRDLLEETLLAYDGIAEASDLTRAMLAVFRNEPRDVVEFTTTAKPGDFGGFAPMVFDHAAKGDAVAGEDPRSAPSARSRTRCACSQLKPGDPLCLLGGLASLYVPLLPQPVRELLKPPLQDALGGAVSMAVRLFRSGEGADE